MLYILQIMPLAEVAETLQKPGSTIAIIAGAVGGGLLGIGLIIWLLLRKSKSAKSDAKPNAKPKKKRKDKLQAPPSQEMIETDYRLITDRILKVNGKCKSVLFAAAGLKCLPITIPVNVAIQLAKEKKCLLIDLDLKRNAIARVFDIAEEPAPRDFRPRAYPTGIENLLIWPGHIFTQLKHMNIKPLVAAAIEKFDLVLINAPYLDSSPDRNQIAAAAACSFIFTKNTKQATRLAELMKTTNCKLIGNIQLAGKKH